MVTIDLSKQYKSWKSIANLRKNLSPNIGKTSKEVIFFFIINLCFIYNILFGFTRAAPLLLKIYVYALPAYVIS